MDAAETGVPPALAVSVTAADTGRVRIELRLEPAGARAGALVSLAARDGGPDPAIAADPEGGVISHGAIAQLVETAQAPAGEAARSRVWTLTVTLSCPSRGVRRLALSAYAMAANGDESPFSDRFAMRETELAIPCAPAS
ncbi:MAG: hypothetical protein KatS3mg119_0346 [Rhodothalassiaceae bacterium]|nr:MAG: hypothetical protein KatS3mg119_0346 [Rhodothalassiaceae bacterium]